MAATAYAALVKVDWQSVIALAAIAGSLATTALSLRWQRKIMRDQWLRDKRAEAYEDYLAYCVLLMKRRHEQMTDPTEPAEPHPAEADGDIPILNRMMMYASRPVLDALRDADDADRMWREACAAWQDTDQPDILRKRTEITVLWQGADVATDRVMETIRREILTGRPRRVRSRDGLANEIERRATDVLARDDPAGDQGRQGEPTSAGL